MQATNFSLPDQNEKIHTLTDYRGKWVVLYFYPKDDTPGCTKEACAFRDNWSIFQKKGIVVLGVSADLPKRHLKFAEKYKLPFTLLSDPEKTTIKAYNAWGLKKMMGREYEGIFRKTFVIDPEGKIAKEYPKVTPAEHAEEIIKEIAEMQK